MKHLLLAKGLWEIVDGAEVIYTPKRNGPARSRVQEQEPKGVLDYRYVDKFVSVISDHIMRSADGGMDNSTRSF